MLAILVLARAVHIGSTMLLVALPYFALVVMQPNDSTDGYGNFRARMWSWWWGALIQATISGVVWFWLVASQMADQSLWQTMSAEDLGTVLWQTWFGQLWLARGIAGFFLAGSMYLAGRRGAGFFSMGSLWAWLALTLSLGLLMSIAGAGHAESGIHDHLFHLAVDGSHLLLGAIWPMGLIPLGLFLRADFTRGENRAGENELRILRRFSRGSLIAVLLLLSTGVMNSFLMIGSWSDLATTTY
jgi:putative copper resistance protein D